MNNYEEESSRDQIEKEATPEEKETAGEIHPETDDPDELDPRLFSPLQESDAAPVEERIPETVQPEEEEVDEECQGDNGQ